MVSCKWLTFQMTQGDILLKIDHSTVTYWYEGLVNLEVPDMQIFVRKY